MSRRTAEFQTIHSEGGLLPPDLLRRVIDPKQQLEGTRSQDYGLPEGERLNEVITQSWSRLRKHWAEFRKAAANLPEGEPGTGLTNDKWNLPLLRELGFGLLPTTAGPEINGRTYAINRYFGPVPIHFVGCRVDLNRRSAGVRGASATNPHGLVQEFLNRSDAHLWGIVSNGLTFRILRDNQALSRQSYLEFDLEAMLDGEVYSDFVLFWLMAHATRFAPRDGNRPGSCWLEEWTKVANEEGTRALGDLRIGVERALQTLGEGFTSHPRNTDLREALRSGQLSRTDFHGQLLRVVYRLIFLFVAEDRRINGQALLHAVDDSEAARIARGRYGAYYSTARLREMASRIKGSRHGDLWRQFQFVTCALSGDSQYAAVRQNLALPALGSFLWDPNSTAAINHAELSNHDFLEALRNLAFTRQGRVLRPVDYKDLGAEELGGVYESLLALTPQISADGARFTFAEFAGNERKTSGSYYTPDSLVQCLLDSALDPVVDEAIKGKTGKEAEQAILSLKVCDPAVGSGHFLVGAAHRLARHLSRLRALAQGESEPSPLMYQHALRDIIGHCLYGVDINPMAAELCRVSLWLEALEPGKPLSFLEHRIQCGNSLLGATPALLAKGIPDEAFDPIEGDDKEVCKEFKRINRDEHKQQGRLFAASTDPWQHLGNLAASMMSLDSIGDDTIEGIREKQCLYEQTIRSGDFFSGRFWADTWCAAFVWKKTRELNYPITEEVFRRIEHNPHAVEPWMRDEIRRLSEQYRFFHWHLAFPDVFHVPFPSRPQNERTGWSGGFDVVLGNPPWEQLEQQSAGDVNTVTAGAQHFVEHSSRYLFTGGGRKNLYGLFAELATCEVAEQGVTGIVVPTGILQDQPASRLAEELSHERRIFSAYDFENRRKNRDGEKWFPDAHPQQRFCLLTVARDSRFARFVFDVGELQELTDPDRFYLQCYEDIRGFCNSGFKVPMFRLAIDARIATKAYSRGVMLGALLNSKPPVLKSGLVFNAEPETNARKQLAADIVDEDGICRIYEGTYIHQYDHRLATVEEASIRYVVEAEKENSDFFAATENYLPTEMVTARLRHMSGHIPSWFVVLRRQARATDSLISISAIIPFAAAEGSLTAFFSADVDPASSALLCANLNSYVFNFLARLRQSGANLNKNVYSQLPVLANATITTQDLLGTQNLQEWMLQRVLELSYSAWDLESFSRECKWSGPPFRWNNERRFLLCCEINAALFFFYLSPQGSAAFAEEERSSKKNISDRSREEVVHILDTFAILRRKDEERWGEYRSKRVILEMYDAMTQGLQAGQPYTTKLDPHPADPTLRHPKKNVGILAYGSLIHDPGEELRSRLFIRIKTQTSFPVEYARISRTRGGAPALAPHPTGAPVNAEILVLDDGVSVEHARDMLWRREVHKVGSNEHYAEGSGPNSVLVRPFDDDSCVNTVLYTDFNESGKLEHPEARDLARRAIESVRTAKEGEDGISYLMNAIAAGITTPLTEAYKYEICQQTEAISLPEALKKAKERASVAGQGGGRD